MSTDNTDITFDVTEGHLVRYFHDRPEDAVEVEDRAACLALLGFTEWHTGGGCMALRVDDGRGNYLLVTEDDTNIPTNADESVTVGAYHSEGPNTDPDVFGGEECECFPSAANMVLYERVIAWLGKESRRMRGQS